MDPGLVYTALKNDQVFAGLVYVSDGRLEGREGKEGHTSAFKLLKDPKTLMFCLIYFVIQMTIYAVTFWLPNMIKGRLPALSSRTTGSIKNAQVLDINDRDLSI